MKNLRKIRESKNISRRKLAKISGVSESTIARIELEGNATTETMITLANTLGCTLDQLCGFEKPEKFVVNLKTQDKLSKLIASLIEIENEWFEGSN